MQTFTDQLEVTAQDLMDAAQQMGHPRTPVTAVLLRGGGLRLYQHCPEAEEWPLDAVIRESGGQAGYRVTGGVRGAQVEARRGQSPLRLLLGAEPTLRANPSAQELLARR